MSSGHWSDGVANESGTSPAGHPAPQREIVGCARCGFDLTGQRIGDPCPECGNVIRQFPVDNRGNSGMAVASLVLGIVSVVVCMFYGVPSLIAGPLAIWFAHKAKKAVREGRAAHSSGGMATAGFICGIVGTVLGALYLIMMVVMFGFMFSAASWNQQGFTPTP